MPALDGEHQAMVRREALAEVLETAALGGDAREPALVDAAARAEEIPPDGASEADHDVAPMAARRAVPDRERRELRDLGRAEDRHAMHLHLRGDRTRHSPTTRCTSWATRRELMREPVAIPFGAAEPIIAFVAERDSHTVPVSAVLPRGGTDRNGPRSAFLRSPARQLALVFMRSFDVAEVAQPGRDGFLLLGGERLALSHPARLDGRDPRP